MNSSSLPHVLITGKVPDEHLAPLDGVAHVIFGPEGARLMAREDVLHLAPQLAGIINQTELQVDAELLEAAPKLKIVANIAIGIDNFDLERMVSHGVWATNTPEAPVESTADCTMGLLLCLSRRLVEADRYVRSGSWQVDGFQPGRWDGILLAGKTLGVVGYGKIGRAVARRARAFDMKIIFHDPLYTDETGYRALHDLLAAADIITLHVPITEETKYLIDAERLKQIKRGALLINAARGKVVQEEALVGALKTGQLGGAALDVFEHEPAIHADLGKMDQVVLSPHIGGGTYESKFAARQLCAENVALVLKGQRPTTPVNQP